MPLALRPCAGQGATGLAPDPAQWDGPDLTSSERADYCRFLADNPVSSYHIFHISLVEIVGPQAPPVRRASVAGRLWPVVDEHAKLSHHTRSASGVWRRKGLLYPRLGGGGLSNRPRQGQPRRCRGFGAACAGGLSCAPSVARDRIGAHRVIVRPEHQVGEGPAAVHKGPSSLRGSSPIRRRVQQEGAAAGYITSDIARSEQGQLGVCR